MADFLPARGKTHWNRPRPPVQDPEVQPLIDLRDNLSYPSGHSTRGTLTAELLAAIDPQRAADFHARGRQIGDDRVIAGVHFPTDVAAGRVLGKAVADALLRDARFQAELARARAEFAMSEPVPPGMR